MLVAGLDFEATGVDPKEVRIIEIGAVLWESDTWEIKDEFSHLVYGLDYPELSQEVIDVTGITPGMLKNTHTLDPKLALRRLIPFIGRAQYIIAHNITYDAILLEAEFKRYGLTEEVPPKKWLCSYMDVPYPKKYRCKQLSHLLLDHGETVDGSASHRALDDVKMIGRLMKRGCYKLEDVIAYRDEPWVYLSITIPKPWEDAGKGAAEAKRQGFSWQKCFRTEEPFFNKQWVKRVKLSRLDAEKNEVCAYPRKIVLRET